MCPGTLDAKQSSVPLPWSKRRYGVSRREESREGTQSGKLRLGVLKDRAGVLETGLEGVLSVIVAGVDGWRDRQCCRTYGLWAFRSYWKLNLGLGFMYGQVVRE